MDPLWIFLIIGLGLGGIFSFIFGTYSTAGTTAYSRTFLGMQSTNLLTNTIVFVVGATVVFLSVVASLVKDLTYPQKSPISFTLEALAMATFSSLTIFLMTILRGYKISSSTFEEFFVLFAKFGVLHILLQFSGFYSYIFPPK
jgi:predicted transglutaminase-like protease